MKLDRRFQYTLLSALTLLLLANFGLWLGSLVGMRTLEGYLGKPRGEIYLFYYFVGGVVGIVGFIVGLLTALFVNLKLSHRWSAELGEEKTKLTCLSFLTFLALLFLMIIVVSRL